MLETVRHICSNCGGELHYNPQEQNFSCENCESSFTEVDLAEIDSRRRSRDENSQRGQDDEVDSFEKQTCVYKCSSCGAEVLADEEKVVNFCCFCNNSVTLEGRASRNSMPKKIIPFKISKKEAEEKFLQWSASKFFLPNDFRADKNIRKITGIYIPFWVADCDVRASMSAIGKELKSWREGDCEVTETKEYQVERKAYFDFNGIPAESSRRFSSKIMEEIEPFNYKECKKFSMKYLSGFQFDNYNVDRSGIFKKVKGRIDNSSEQMLRKSAKNYSRLEVQDLRADILQTDWNCIMLPVWMLTYNYGGRRFTFAVNGQTGKFAGKFPISWKKANLFAGAIALVVSAIVFYLM